MGIVTLDELGFAVAIAYHLQKTPYVFPIIGGRKVENLRKNVEALTITLSDEQMKYLNDTVPFEKGFPYALFVSPGHVQRTYDDSLRFAG